mmetsp:Transcript_33339/g.73716  ORF Transcript_33339/g.73716 Transcript_33339/m.73716 type:complete len:89 (-) Transcript_33339:631-897(-)
MQSGFSTFLHLLLQMTLVLAIWKQQQVMQETQMGAAAPSQAACMGLIVHIITSISRSQLTTSRQPESTASVRMHAILISMQETRRGRD